MTDAQLLAEMGTDAARWAAEYVRRHGGDEGLMTSWFANAIEAGRCGGVDDLTAVMVGPAPVSPTPKEIP